MLTERLRNLGEDRLEFYRDVILTAISGILIVIVLLLIFAYNAPTSLVVLLSIVSLLFTGVPIIINSIKGLMNLETNVDELVSIALIALVILQEYITAAIVAFIMTLGAIIEEIAAGRARKDIEAIVDQSPTHAYVLRESQFIEEEIENIVKGDCVLVRPGDVIPIDGVIVKGRSNVDEANLTGESILKEKVENDNVYTGTINHEGALEIQVEKVGEDTTYGKIITLIKEAEDQRIPPRRVIDKYVKWYTPIILVVAFTSWFITQDYLVAVSILVVSCPCALVLATPVTVISGLANASRHGVLVKKGEYLEACAGIDFIALDKTGTLTHGQPQVKSIVPFNGMNPREVLTIAAKAESHSEHPIAKAILTKAHEEGIDINYEGNLQAISGWGIEATTDSQHIFLGSRRFIEQKGYSVPQGNNESSGQTALFLAQDNELIGKILIEDDIREEVQNMIELLRKKGIENIFMITGDSEDVATHVGEICGISPDGIIAELLPDQKLGYIQALQDDNWNVCYVGDGVNDGPALAKANLGISISSKQNTVALETSDIVLMRSDLELVPYILELGQKTKNTISANLVFAFIYGVLMLVLAFLGIVTPFLGAIGHNIGSILVALNSIRLTRFRGSIAQ
jgi:Cd2+/Zn2+-exporting ATPase